MERNIALEYIEHIDRIDSFSQWAHDQGVDCKEIPCYFAEGDLDE